jgi:hypothetical protein
MIWKNESFLLIVRVKLIYIAVRVIKTHNNIIKYANFHLIVSIIYQILLTMLMTIASTIGNFLKLKLLKNNLRSSFHKN